MFKEDGHVEHCVDLLSLLKATGDIANSLLVYQKGIFKSIQANLDKCHKIISVAELLLHCTFDCLRMPLQNSVTVHAKLLV